MSSIGNISTYTQQNFNTDFGGTTIKVDDNLLTQVDNSLSGLNKTPEERANVKEKLMTVAGQDGLIRGAELNDLFTAVDSYDQNGSGKSFTASTTKDGLSTPTMSGTILNTLLGARTKSENITASDMAMRFADAAISIKVDSLQEAFATAIDAGKLVIKLSFAELGELKKCAGPDGSISTPQEFDRLFALLDKKDGTEDGLITTKQSALGQTEMKSTIAGDVLDILTAHAQKAQVVTKNDYIESHTAGYYDLKMLTPEDLSALRELGFNMGAINYQGAQKGGIIQGKKAAETVFASLSSIDAGNDASRLRLSNPIAMGKKPAEKDLTSSGKANAILEKCYVGFEQPYRSYTDLSRAAKEGTPHRADVALNVPCYPQTDPTGCYRTCRKMLKDFNSKIDAKVIPGGDGAHYTAISEDAAGRVMGRKGAFTDSVKYIDTCLEAGRPVIIGISDRDADYNTDKITDHFIIITGRKTDEDGNIVYTYNDPATSGPQRTGPLYVDKDSGMLFRPDFVRSAGQNKRQYQLTQIRPYTDSGFTFKDVVGHAVNPPAK